MHFLLLFYFQGEGGGFLNNYGGLLLPFLIVGFFYFVLIRPQRQQQLKQQEELKNMIAELKINDEIVTNGGVIGRIKESRETSFIIQSADKSFIEIARTAVVGKRAEK